MKEEWKEAAAESELEKGKPVSVEIDGEPVL